MIVSSSTQKPHTLSAKLAGLYRVQSCLLLVAALLASSLVACTDEQATGEWEDDFVFEEQSVSPFDSESANFDVADLPVEGSAADEYPRRFDLLDIQSPVRDQGGRGLCTIFVAVAFAEAAYRKAGLIPNPDFSEQALQWSLKTEARRTISAEGSRIEDNFFTMATFGLTREELWPYETERWTIANNPACDRRARAGIPLWCNTNGAAPPGVVLGHRSHIREGRYISAQRHSVMGHMVRTGLPVSTGGAFFYQSWSHRKSTLPIFVDFKERGIVQSPNPSDVADSEDRAAGHEVLIVGWDQDMEIQRIDTQGNPQFDLQGNPVLERGFFLIRNSWGTHTWGTRTEVTREDGSINAAPGYGWISMDYVETRWRRAYATDAQLIAENIEPNTGLVSRYESDLPTAIPDNNRNGVSQEISIEDQGVVQDFAFHLEITHPYPNELLVTLQHGGKSYVVPGLENARGGDIHQTFHTDEFNGMEAQGIWRLTVRDNTRRHAGTLHGFHLDLRR